MSGTTWQELRRHRPRSPFVAWSLRLFVLMLAASWWLGDFSLGGGQWTRRLANLQRFLGEIRPWPIRESGDWSWAAFLDWAGQLWSAGGGRALLATLAMSVVAMALASLLGGLAALPAARNFSAPAPYLPSGRRPGVIRRALHGILVGGTRFLLLFVRSLPEYVWAFIFLALLGPTAWPLILALALHNAGILGKLGAEVVENTGSAAPTMLRALGAGRFQIALAGILPLALPRFLLYIFYRWETCVREATVLGMLGVPSLGFLLVQARAGNRYDEMVFFILLGTLLILAGDLASALVRRWVRRA